MRDAKPIRWMGSSLENLRGFPEEARREAGADLRRVQRGDDPLDWKTFEQIGSGTREIRIRSIDGAFRVLYVAKFDEAVYVLHCFDKKSRKTSPRDVAMGKRRYNAMLQERRDMNHD